MKVHVRVTEEQWLKVRGLSRDTYQGPMYLVACGQVIYVGDSLVDRPDEATCADCRKSFGLEPDFLKNAPCSLGYLIWG